MSVLQEKLKQYEGKIDDAIKQAKLSAADETSVRQIYAVIKAKNPAKYVPFLIKHYKESDVSELINTFETSTHKVQNKDINSYTIDALRDALHLTDTKKSRKELKSEGAQLVFENDKVRVYHITTKAASCMYGGNTSWCTAKSGLMYFEMHRMIGNLYYVLSKYRAEDDPLYKIAVLVLATGEKRVFDVPQTAGPDGYRGAIANKMLTDEVFHYKVTMTPLKEKLKQYRESSPFQAPSEDDLVQRNIVDMNLTKNPDGTYSCDGDVWIKYTLVNKDGKLPIKFKHVKGTFDCARAGLTTLEGCPETVGGTFRCSRNDLKTLEGAPKKVGGDFWCMHNNLSGRSGVPLRFTIEDVEAVSDVKRHIYT